MEKSDKLIPSCAGPSWKQLNTSLDGFFTSLATKITFMGKNTPDPLKGLRRKWLQGSTWKPDDKNLPDEFHSFRKAVVGDAHVKFDRLKWQELVNARLSSQFEIFGNYCYADIWATSWLRKSHLFDVPCDKGLGTAITTRAFYGTEAAKHLSASFEAIDNPRFNFIIADTKARISKLSQEASLQRSASISIQRSASISKLFQTLTRFRGYACLSRSTRIQLAAGLSQLEHNGLRTRLQFS